MLVCVSRGYLSCLAHPEGQGSVLSIWDLCQAHRDRIFRGQQAIEMAQLFADGIKERNSTDHTPDSSSHQNTCSRVHSVTNHTTDVTLRQTSSADIPLLEFDTTGEICTAQKMTHSVCGCRMAGGLEAVPEWREEC